MDGGGRGVIGELVQRLIDAGTPPLVAAVVVSEAFAAGAMSRTVGGLSADETTVRRREYDRERQRLKRELARMSADNTRMSAESADASYNNNSFSQEKDSIKEEKKVRARKKKSADFLPTDWQPNENHFAAADRLKIPHPAVLEKAEDLRLWAAGNGIARADWDATFHTFLRRDAERLRGSSDEKSVHAAAHRLVERMRQFDEPAPGEIRDGEGENIVRLLSKG
jgi:hypothetical protein